MPSQEYVCFIRHFRVETGQFSKEQFELTVGENLLSGTAPLFWVPLTAVADTSQERYLAAFKHFWHELLG